MTLTVEEIAERWEGLEGGSQEPPTTPHKYIRTLDAISESLIDALRVEDGINLGLPQIDLLTRGFRPTDLVVVTGFAASAKTQVVNTMILKSPDKRILFFSIDDPAELILAKLVAMHSGISATRIEDRIREGDEATKRLVRETARDHYPNLFIVDDVIGIPNMREAVDEATEAWGHTPDAVVVDYVEIMPDDSNVLGDASSVKRKMNELKAWAKAAPYPIIAIHQGTRTNAKPGEPVTLLSLGYSGEQQATLVIGVRRKRDQLEMPDDERRRHQETVTLHVLKNKRPGGKLTLFEGIDFHIEASTGLISPIQAESLSATAAVRQSLDVVS